MANWVEGTLKIRGKKKNVFDFLNNGLVDTYTEAAVKANEKNEIVYDHSLWIKETRRGFLDSPELYLWYYDGFSNSDVIIVSAEAEFAWEIDVAGLAELSQKHNIDFKIYGFEKNCGFNQDVEIIGGRITKNNEIVFENYHWECICPNKGG